MKRSKIRVETEEHKRIVEQKRLRFLLGLLAFVILLGIVSLPWQIRIRRHLALLHQQELQRQALQRAQEQMNLALQQAAQEVQLHPNDPAAHARYAALLEQQGRFSEAEEQWQKAVLLDPKDTNLHVAYAACLDGNGKEDVAMLEYERALRLDPNNLRAALGLALRYITLGWNQNALALLKRQLKAHGDSSKLHETLAMAYFQLTRLSEAERELLKAQQLDPHDPSIFGPLAEVYWTANNPQKALVTLDQAIAQVSDPTMLLLERAKIYNTIGQPDKALLDAETVLRQDPHNLEALFQKGRALQFKGDLRGAIRAWQLVYDSAPDMDNVGLLLGRALIALGRRAAGRELVQESLQRMRDADEWQSLGRQIMNAPNSVPLHLRLAQYYLRIGNLPRAIIEFRAVCQLDPHNAAGREGLKIALQKAGRPLTELSLATTPSH
ncbi:tetratricopeptide repeat protein [Chthonomonas calidirosea]|nr:tetratricopeptide repeat protein [Chthonomonas calidirosea]